MTQQGVKNWVVRVVGPKKEVEYYLVGSSASSDAKQRVKDTLVGLKRTDGWTVEEPIQPREI